MISKERAGKRCHCTAWQMSSLIASAIPCCCLCQYFSFSLSVSFPSFCLCRYFSLSLSLSFPRFCLCLQTYFPPSFPFPKTQSKTLIHKYLKNSLTEQHNSHLNKVHLKLQRNWRSAWTRSRNDKRYISKKIKTNLDQEQVLELVAANKVPENLLVEFLVAAQVLACIKFFPFFNFQFSLDISDLEMEMNWYGNILTDILNQYGVEMCLFK